MKVAFFGEVMLRLTPALPKQLLLASDQWQIDFAGAEANVATSLANLGHECRFVSVFPENLLGDKAISSLRKFGLDTQYCQRDGNRIGTYFIELGESIRPTKVVYDRENSAFSQCQTIQFNWQEILDGCDWLFLGGISLALSNDCAQATLEAAKQAKSCGVKVAFDMNFRRSLWQNPEQAKPLFEEILLLADLAFGNAGVMADVFDYPVQFDNFQANLSSTVAAAEYLKKAYQIDVAFSVRDHLSASQNRLSAVFVGSNETPHVTAKPIDVEIADRLGTGDAFAAGVLHGLINDRPSQELIEFANASFALAHTQFGDHQLLNQADIQTIADGKTSGHVIR